MTARYLRGFADTNILIYLERLATDPLPAELLTSTVTLAELSAGVHATEDTAERSRRILRVQRVEATFTPLAIRRRGDTTIRGHRRPGDQHWPQAARARRRPDDRKHRRRQQTPLFTTNPADFQGLESVVAVVPVPIPPTGP
jgi:hypothetical protein